MQQLSGCTHPPTGSSCWCQVPTTLLISLCLSLLTISSSTSPSPLISLEDKDRPTSCEGYWQIPTSHAVSQPQKAMTPPSPHPKSCCCAPAQARSHQLLHSCTCWADAPLGKTSDNLSVRLHYVTFFWPYQA